MQRSEIDKNNLKWGVFYYNKDDKDLFRAKKNKDMGLVINFAHPTAKYYVIVLLCIIVIPFVLLFFIK